METYVREAVSGLASATPDEEEALVAKGIFLVRRIAFALPPEASLREALREHLAEGLTALRDEADPPEHGPGRHRLTRLASRRLRGNSPYSPGAPGCDLDV